jgi:hypothetical protein
MFLLFMFDFMVHILYNIKIMTGLAIPCHVNKFLPYTPSLCVPYTVCTLLFATHGLKYPLSIFWTFINQFPSIWSK